MRKLILKTAVAAAMIACAPMAHAQSNGLGGLLGAIAGQQSGTAGTLLGALGNLLGTASVSEQSLVGTWSYSQPCVAFDSSNMLNQIGGEVASSAVQKRLKKGMEKAGIKAGKCSLAFRQDHTFTFTVGKKTQQGSYAVNGSTLTLTFAITGRQVAANVKLVNNALQIAMKADKMLQVVNTVATKASAYSNQMGTVSALLNGYSGMHLGMEFKR